MPGAGAGAERADEFPGAVVHLNAVVARVGDGEAVAGRGIIDCARRVKLPAVYRE